jgi:hypothetical protein
MAGHDGAGVGAVFIDEAQIGQAARQLWAGDVDLPDGAGLERAHCRPAISLDQRGAGPDGCQRAPRPISAAFAKPRSDATVITRAMLRLWKGRKEPPMHAEERR